jgi:hypothetical protein
VAGDADVVCGEWFARGLMRVPNLPVIPCKKRTTDLITETAISIRISLSIRESNTSHSRRSSWGELHRAIFVRP